MPEGMYGKIKRNLGRAFDFSSSSDIRNRRDQDETTSNLDYMTSRGKKRTPQDQSDVPAGLRRSRSIAPEADTDVDTNQDRSGMKRFLGIRKKITDTIQGKPMSANQGPTGGYGVGVASNAVGLFQKRKKQMAGG